MDLARPLQVVTPSVDGDVLTVLARADADFTVPQVAKLVGKHSESGIRNSLRRLADQGVVTVARHGHVWLYRMNRRHLATPHIVGLANMRDTLIDQARSVIETWREQAEFVALFGSAATGRMHLQSDLDVFVVRPDRIDPENPVWLDQLDGLMESLTAWTGNDARVLEMNRSEVAEGIQTLRVLQDIRVTGIPLAGHRRYLAQIADGSR